MATYKEILGKNGKKFQVTIRVKGYKPLYKTFEKKTEAKNWATEVELQMRKGIWNKANYEKNVSPIVTVSDLIDDFEKNVAPKRYSKYYQYKVMYDWWRNKIGHLNLCDLNPNTLTQCKNILSGEAPNKNYKDHETKSNSTVRKYMFALSAILRYGMRELQIIDTNPMSCVDKPRKNKGVVRFLSNDERKCLLAACKENSDVLHLFVILAAFSGGRYSELLHLTVENIDFVNEMVYYVATKNGESRGVPIYHKLADMLREYLDKNNITVGSRAYRDMEYSIDELEKISKAFGVDLLQISWIKSKLDKNEAINSINNEFINENDIIADYFPDVLASCGNGAFELSQIREKIRVPKMCIEQYMPFARYSVINAYGDSMQPTIQSKDKLVIELLSESDRIKDNNIYVFFYNDRIFCKRLVQNIDSIMVISDNPDKNIYPTSRIEKENMNEIHLIGRIVGLMRGMV